ncbi:response regulator [Polyangium spumosum]|nr:response regulator [Polyangium spumosum]
MDSSGAELSPPSHALTARERALEAALAAEKARASAGLMLASALSQSLTPEKIVSVMLHYVTPLLHAPVASAFLLATGADALERVERRDKEAPGVASSTFLPLSAPLPECEVVRTGKAVWIESLDDMAERFPVLCARARRTGRHAFVCLPLAVEGRAYGVISFELAGARAFPASEQAFLLGLAQQCAQALDRARLEAAEQRLRLALDAGAIGIWDLDLSAGQVEADARCRAVMGLPAAGEVDRDGFFGQVHSDDAERVLAAVRRALEPASGGALLEELRVDEGQPEPRWVALRGQVTFDAEGAPTRLVGGAADITERIRAEQERARRLSKLGHDLRNPLSPMLTALQLMRMRAPDVLVKERTILERQVAHLSCLVDELLDVSRTTLGKVERPRKPCETAVVAGPPQVAAPERRRILLVDDNRDAAEMLAEGLRVFGYEVTVAHDGPSSLSIANEAAPDLALLDIGLPGMDGYELARRLQDIPGLSEVLLVALTGYGQKGARARSTEAGFRAHLVKPVELSRMVTLLETLGLPPASPPQP